MWPFKKKKPKQEYRMITRDELIESILKMSREQYDLTYEEVIYEREVLEDMSYEDLAFTFVLFSLHE